MRLTRWSGALIRSCVLQAPGPAPQALGRPSCSGARPGLQPAQLVPARGLRQGCTLQPRQLASLMVKGAKKNFYAVHTGRKTGTHRLRACLRPGRSRQG